MSETTKAEMVGNLHMVLARLDSPPSSTEEWDAIIEALRKARALAFRERDALI